MAKDTFQSMTDEELREAYNTAVEGRNCQDRHAVADERRKREKQAYNNRQTAIAATTAMNSGRR